MGERKRRSRHEPGKFQRRVILGTYDTIPRPKGEFRDLFKLMQEMKEKNENDTSEEEM